MAFLNFPWERSLVLTGDQIRAARERAGWSQAELAERVGVSQRSIGNYERSQTVPRSASSRVEEVLADFLNRELGNPLRAASDVALLAEIARRFDRAREREEQVDGTAISRDGGSPSPGSSEQQIDTIHSPGGIEIALDEQSAPVAPKAAHPKQGRESTGRRLRAELDEVGEANQEEVRGE